MTPRGNLGALGEGPGAWAASSVPQDPGRFWLDWLCLVEHLPYRSVPCQLYRVGVRTGALVSGAQTFPIHK